MHQDDFRSSFLGMSPDDTDEVLDSLKLNAWRHSTSNISSGIKGCKFTESTAVIIAAIEKVVESDDLVEYVAPFFHTVTAFARTKFTVGQAPELTLDDKLTSVLLFDIWQLMLDAEVTRRLAKYGTLTHRIEMSKDLAAELMGFLRPIYLEIIRNDLRLALTSDMSD